MSGVPSDPSIKFGTCRCKVWQQSRLHKDEAGVSPRQSFEIHIYVRTKRTTFSTERVDSLWGYSLKINQKKQDANEDSGGPRQWFSISDRTTENVNLPVCTRNAGNKFYLGRKHSISIFITDTITVFVNKVQIVTKIISTRCFPLEPFPPKSGP